MSKSKQTTESSLAVIPTDQLGTIVNGQEYTLAETRNFVASSVHTRRSHMENVKQAQEAVDEREKELLAMSLDELDAIFKYEKSVKIWTCEVGLYPTKSDPTLSRLTRKLDKTKEKLDEFEREFMQMRDHLLMVSAANIVTDDRYKQIEGDK